MTKLFGSTRTTILCLVLGLLALAILAMNYQFFKFDWRTLAWETVGCLLVGLLLGFLLRFLPRSIKDRWLAFLIAEKANDPKR